jgi:hypothetical protein
VKATLLRRVVAEFTGTLLLLAAVVGSCDPLGIGSALFPQSVF